MTTFEFYQKFGTEKSCLDYLEKIRWNDKRICPHCGHTKSYTLNEKSITRPTRFKCASSKCYKKFSVTTKTIFDSCKAPLVNFFYLIYSSTINKKNTSSHQQSINLGMTQTTAWAIMSRIRMLCYQDNDLKLEGEVEVDETYLRSCKYDKKKQAVVRAWQKHGESRLTGKKTPILGLLERGGKIVIKVIPNKSKKVVQKIILKHVECGSRLFTDSAPCYHNMDSYYLHESVNHREGEYVRDDVYTNGIECAWTHLKRALVGTHGGVSSLHLQRYCDEFAYRWNTKHMSAIEKFNDLLKKGTTIKPIRYKTNVVLKVDKRNLFNCSQGQIDEIPVVELSAFQAIADRFPTNS